MAPPQRVEAAAQASPYELYKGMRTANQAQLANKYNGQAFNYGTQADGGDAYGQQNLGPAATASFNRARQI